MLQFAGNIGCSLEIYSCILRVLVTLVAQLIRSSDKIRTHQNTITMRKPVVLVTSATSRNGSYAAKLLFDTNKFIVRLGTRNPAVLQEFVAHGAEAVVLDSRVESIRKAFSGVHYVYIILPAMPGGGEHLMFKNFLQAAWENGVCKHIVYLSAIDAAFPTEKFATFHKHYEHEQMLICGGETLRPGEKPRFYTKQF